MSGSPGSTPASSLSRRRSSVVLSHSQGWKPPRASSVNHCKRRIKTAAAARETARQPRSALQPARSLPAAPLPSPRASAARRVGAAAASPATTSAIPATHPKTPTMSAMRSAPSSCTADQATIVSVQNQRLAQRATDISSARVSAATMRNAGRSSSGLANSSSMSGGAARVVAQATPIQAASERRGASAPNQATPTRNTEASRAAITTAEAAETSPRGSPMARTSVSRAPRSAASRTADGTRARTHRHAATPSKSWMVPTSTAPQAVTSNRRSRTLASAVPERARPIRATTGTSAISWASSARKLRRARLRASGDASLRTPRRADFAARSRSSALPRSSLTFASRAARARWRAS